MGADLEALKQELLALLQRNTQIVARARSHAADLNHALKNRSGLLVAAASASPPSAPARCSSKRTPCRA